MGDREVPFCVVTRVLAIAACGLGLGACGDAGSGIEHDEVDATRSDPTAAVVTIDGHTLAGDGMSTFRCTGILLSPNVVLTSGACTRGLSYGYPNASTSWSIRLASNPTGEAVGAMEAESAWPLTIDEHVYSEYAAGDASSREAAKIDGGRDVGVLVLGADQALCIRAYPMLGLAEDGARAAAFARGAWQGEDTYGDPVDREVVRSPTGEIAFGASGWATLEGVDAARVAGAAGPPRRCSLLEKLFLGCPSVSLGQADRGGPIVSLAGGGELSSIVGVATGVRVGEAAEIALIQSGGGSETHPGTLEWIQSIVRAHPAACDAN